MLEKTISEIITRYPLEVWPDLRLTFVERERRLAGGNILDLHFRDEADVDWIIELKRHRVTQTAVLQLARYLTELRSAEPRRRFRGMVVAPGISPGGKREADRQDIACRTIDETELRRIASSHGLALDHESDHRPKLAGSSVVRSRVKSVRGNRPATSDDDVEFLRSLDARYPPGSLVASTAITDLQDYWRLATPMAPPQSQDMAAHLTFEVLQALPHATVSNRSHGRSDPYSTIRGVDGRVAAAIDARKTYAKLDFPLPPDLATRYQENGKLRIWKPRGYSVWCQSRVGQTLPFEDAVELLRVGLAFEFQGKRIDTHE